MSEIVYQYRGVQLWQTHRGFELVENGRLLAVIKDLLVAERLYFYRALALATAELEATQQQAAFTEEGKRVFFPPPSEPMPAPKPKKPREVFQKPTVEEIDAYCAERKNGLSGQAIFDHYEANGWMVGRVKMRDWKAAVRTWERKEKEKPAPPPRKGVALTNPEHSSLDIEFEEALMRHRPKFKKKESEERGGSERHLGG